MTAKAKWLVICGSALAVAGIAILIVALILKWDIIGGLTCPVAIVIYAIIGVAGVGLLAGWITKKARLK